MIKLNVDSVLCFFRNCEKSPNKKGGEGLQSYGPTQVNSWEKEFGDNPIIINNVSKLELATSTKAFTIAPQNFLWSKFSIKLQTKYVENIE